MKGANHFHLRGCLLIWLTLLSLTLAVKECLQPIRSKVWDAPCYEAEVPRTIPAVSQLAASKDFCPSGLSNDVVDACTFVAQAIHADLAVFDIVILNQGTCHSGIPEGGFDHRDAATLLPYRNELIGLHLLGKHIVSALQHGRQLAKAVSSMAGAYPVAAGIRYDWDQSVSNVQVMGYNCGYQPLEPDRIYSVLTNQYLAQGGDGYAFFSQRSLAVTPTGISETDAFWFHAHSTCRLETQWKTTQQLEDELAAQDPKMVYLAGFRTSKNQTALAQK